MQKLAEICIRRPVFAAMIVLSLVVIGAAGFFRLGVDRFPSVDLPTVSVRVTLPGAAPEEVESSAENLRTLHGSPAEPVTPREQNQRNRKLGACWSQRNTVRRESSHTAHS